MKQLAVMEMWPFMQLNKHSRDMTYDWHQWTGRKQAARISNLKFCYGPLRQWNGVLQNRRIIFLYEQTSFVSPQYQNSKTFVILDRFWNSFVRITESSLFLRKDKSEPNIVQSGTILSSGVKKSCMADHFKLHCSLGVSSSTGLKNSHIRLL